MLKKISSVDDIASIQPGDEIFDNPNILQGNKFKVYKKMLDDLIVIRNDGDAETKLLTSHVLLSRNWWKKI